MWILQSIFLKLYRLGREVGSSKQISVKNIFCITALLPLAGVIGIQNCGKIVTFSLVNILYALHVVNM